MNDEKLSERGLRIVAALNQFASDLEAGLPLDSKYNKYNVRQVRVVSGPRAYSPDEVRAVRELIGVSQQVLSEMLAVSLSTVRSWEQGARRPSAITRRFLDEIQMAPEHFRGRIVAVSLVVKAEPTMPAKKT